MDGKRLIEKEKLAAMGKFLTVMGTIKAAGGRRRQIPHNSLRYSALLAAARPIDSVVPTTTAEKRDIIAILSGR